MHDAHIATRPIRILELRSVRGTGGGPEKTILHGAAQTDASRFAVTVCYLRDQRDTVFVLDGRARSLGVDYTEVLERSSFDPRVFGRLRRLVRERSIDIVHAHDYKTDLLAWALGATERIIPLATSHGWSGRSWKELRLYYPADKRLLTRFPLVFAVSEPIRQEILRVGGGADRVRVLRNGIDQALYRRTVAARVGARLRLGLRADQIAVGAVGRLDAGKRFDLLVDAVARLTPSHPELVLLIAGEGDERPSLERLIERQPSGVRCRLVGQVDAIEFHHALDLFAQSSDSEGSPNVVLEAMALETPLVATDVGGTRDLVSHGVHGLLVRPGDPHALAEAIATSLASPAETRARALAARQRVEAELSFAARMATLEASYEALADGRRREAS